MKLQIDDIEVDLTLKRIRSVILRVQPPDGRISVSAPIRMDLERVQRFVRSKRAWIEKQQTKVRGRKVARSLEYEDDESHEVWGRRVPLKVVEGARRVTAGVQDGRLVLKVRRDAHKARRKAALDAWYRREVEISAPPLLAKWESVIGVKAGKLRVRRMKTRWGSCNIANRSICLNSELAKRDPRGLEYVVVHELVHLLERRHNARFKRIMERFLPGWKMIKKDLNQMVVD